MPVASRPRRRGIWLLAAGSLVASLSFLALRVVGPSDGAVVPFYADPWTADGVHVEPIHPASDGLLPGDLVVAVAGRPLAAWLDGALDPGLDRSVLRAGDRVEYTVRRDGRAVSVPVVLGAHDVSGILIANWSVLLFTLVLQVVAAYVLWRRPEASAAVALIVAACGVTGSTLPWLLGLQVSDIVAGWPFLLHAATAGGLYMLLWPAGALHLPLAMSAPVGGPRRRTLSLAYGIPLGAYVLGLVLARVATTSTPDWVGTWSIIQLSVIAPTVLAGIALSVRGYRAAHPATRHGVRWAVVGGGVASVVGLALFMGPELITGRSLIPWSAVGLVALPLPLGVAVGILRHGLFDIEVVVNRALVYGGLTLSVLLIYVGTVLAVGSLLGSESSFAVSLLGTGLAAVAALPLRDALQRMVNRVMYGDRDEPWRALSRLGQRLELAIDPDAVFPAIVETVADALRLPYVALELGSPGDGRLVSSRGSPGAEETSIPLVYGAEPVGRLLLGSRPGEGGFSPNEIRLLQDLARQAGVAVHAVRLREDLLRSREHLVTAREEERRRLRRDLHDGLGPSLAAIGLRAEAAAAAIRGDPEKAERILVEQAGEVRSALADIRRLVEGLRPPALDELGLVGAIRQQAERFEESAATERPGPRVTVEAPERLPDLPAAIEVAAYRIAVEALTNAVRHSGARQCRVRIAEGDGLLVEVLDDGLGLPPDAPPGVGLESMRQRAAEVGGRCIIERRPAGGTQVRAWLPLPTA